MEESNLQEIPVDFYSFETNQPFEHCIECERHLFDNNLDYVIEKAIKTYPGYSASDTIFDYAICTDCALNMRNDFSKESLNKIDQYFAENSDLQKIIGDLADMSRLDKCIIKEIPREELTEYQIYAYCKGKFLNTMIPPYLVSSYAIDEILPLISQPTTDFLNGFYNKHFSPDPSLMEPTPKLVFI